VPREALVAKFVSLAERPDAEALAARILALDASSDVAVLEEVLTPEPIAVS